MARDTEYNEPAPKKSKTLMYVLGGIGAVLLLGCCCCLGGGGYFWNENNKLEKQVETEAGIPVTAVALSAAYKDNAAGANAQYQAKVVQITGTVTKVNSPAEIELAGAPGGDPVRCQAVLSKMSLFQGVTVGQTVTVKGYSTGKPLGYLQVSMCQSVTKK